MTTNVYFHFDSRNAELTGDAKTVAENALTELLGHCTEDATLEISSNEHAETFTDAMVDVVQETAACRKAGLDDPDELLAEIESESSDMTDWVDHPDGTDELITQYATTDMDIETFEQRLEAMYDAEHNNIGTTTVHKRARPNPKCILDSTDYEGDSYSEACQTADHMFAQSLTSNLGRQEQDVIVFVGESSKNTVIQREALDNDILTITVSDPNVTCAGDSETGTVTAQATA